MSLFSFKGRIGRINYIATLFICFFLITIFKKIGVESQDNIIIICTKIVMLFLYYIIFSQGAKRCHDINLSGWYQIIPFFPFILMLKRGTTESNKYE